MAATTMETRDLARLTDEELLDAHFGMATPPLATNW